MFIFNNHLLLLTLAAVFKLNSSYGGSSDSGNSLPVKDKLGHSGAYGDYGIPFDSHIPEDNAHISDSGLTVTQISTIDTYSTITETFYNSVPVTLTEFIKSTVTIPTEEVLRTAVDDLVRVTTIEVTKPSTQTVTDVSSVFSCVTEVSTDVYTITHFDQHVLQTILTSTIVQTHTFRPTIVQTRIQTEVTFETETIASTNTAWIEVVLSTFTKYH